MPSLPQASAENAATAKGEEEKRKEGACHRRQRLFVFEDKILNPFNHIQRVNHAASLSCRAMIDSKKPRTSTGAGPVFSIEEGG